MLKNTNQNNANIEGSGNKIIGGDDKSQTNNYYSSNGKLSSLFEKLKASVDNSQEIEKISAEFNVTDIDNSYEIILTLVRRNLQLLLFS